MNGLFIFWIVLIFVMPSVKSLTGKGFDAEIFQLLKDACNCVDTIPDQRSTMLQVYFLLYPLFFLGMAYTPKVKSKIVIKHSHPFNGWIADADDFSQMKKTHLLFRNWCEIPSQWQDRAAQTCSTWAHDRSLQIQMDIMVKGKFQRVAEDQTP